MVMDKPVYLTAEGKVTLEEELSHLKSVRRPEVADRIQQAKMDGDISESGEYEDAKNEQAWVEERIRTLEHMIQNAHIIKGANGDTVGLGSIVLVRDLDLDDEWEYSVVDPVQADPVNDKISIQSPVGQALLNKKVGDVVEVQIPAGAARYEILSLRH